MVLLHLFSKIQRKSTKKSGIKPDFLLFSAKYSISCTKIVRVDGGDEARPTTHTIFVPVAIA